METNKQKKDLSLKTKLVGMSIGSLLILGLASLGVLNHLVKLQEEGQKNAFESYAVNLSDAISAQFFERYGDIQAFAISPAIQSNNPKTIIHMLDTFSAMYAIYDLIMVVDSNGKLVAVNHKGPDGSDLNVGPLYEKNYSDAPWFKAVMSGSFTEDKEKGFAGTYVEHPQIDPLTSQVFGTNRLGSAFSAAIKDAHGKTIGVITNRAGSRWFEIAFKEVYASMKKQGLVQSSLSLLNKDGTLFYQYTPNEGLGAEGKYDWDKLTKFNILKDGNEKAEFAFSGQSGSRIQSGANPEIMGFSPVESKKFTSSLGWTVVVKDHVQEAFEKVSLAKKFFYLVFSIVSLLAVGAAYWFATFLSRKLIRLAEALSQGGDQLALAASQIAQSSMQLSEASVEQAAAIQETAASIDEVSAMVKKNSENATLSQETSQKSRHNADLGKKSIQKMIQSIAEISESNDRIIFRVSEGNKKISEIVQLISEIGNKTKIINDIVFQTKLLSFNASVEAARAGEHGKGFAVVAEEVGNLARMSGIAAKEISEMLEGSISKVESIIKETKNSVDQMVVEGKAKVELGKSTALECGDALSHILTSVQEVDSMVSEIASASLEQSQGVEEINKAMNQLDQVTQKNTTVSQRSAESAEQLNEQSQKLRVVVKDLLYLLSGTDASNQEHHDSENKVIPLRQKKAEFEIPERLKIAVGDNQYPSNDDPRFEDL